MGRIRASYMAKEKLTAVAYTEEHGNRAAGRQFSVNEACVRHWQRQKDVLMKQNKTRRANRGRTAQYPGIESELMKLVTDRRSKGIAVSSVEIHLEAMKVTKSSSQPDFKGKESMQHDQLYDINISELQLSTY
ncbi:uncharacterized protein LOC123558124 [Mercenaria mercenaria]|uniref:uncharacterized protein LOC123558124 n=1 Tax=Mercenaria mercenaria TaxID=6596 RepID=UPI001E1D79DC|nr:uncharacterized protein LOC123558124 [Mercenaria mercenaria]